MTIRQLIREYFEGPGTYNVGFLHPDGFVKTLIAYGDNTFELRERIWERLKEIGIKIESVTYIEKLKL